MEEDTVVDPLARQDLQRVFPSSAPRLRTRRCLRNSMATRTMPQGCAIACCLVCGDGIGFFTIERTNDDMKNPRLTQNIRLPG
ncbi:MAG TPA: hypothetical protein EYP67_02755 [Methanosarcinales archaeon]|nr:hypothetical protein [Methanosarcinales archaeon]